MCQKETENKFLQKRNLKKKMHDSNICLEGVVIELSYSIYAIWLGEKSAQSYIFVPATTVFLPK
jgi:hypothetical protein